jgi:hypothetical protein
VALPVRLDSDALLPHVQSSDARVLAKIDPYGGRLFDEVCVEPLPLCEVDERDAVPALERPAVPEAEIHLRSDFLDDRFDRERQEPRGTLGYAAAAGLVARKARAIEKQDVLSGRCQAVGGGRAGRPGPDDDRVVASHGSILSIVVAVVGTFLTGRAKTEQAEDAGRLRTRTVRSRLRTRACDGLQRAGQTTVLAAATT